MSTMIETPRMADAIEIKAGMSFEMDDKIWGVVAFRGRRQAPNGLAFMTWAIATEDGDEDELRLFTFDRMPVLGDVSWV